VGHLKCPNYISTTQTQKTQMRKIEKQMIEAIKSETDWKSDNTKVINFYNDDKECVVTSVFLHDNLIAEVGDTFLTIFDGGWESNTTKSRLNVLINEFCNALTDGIFQKQHVWYVRDNNEVKEWTGSYHFA